MARYKEYDYSQGKFIPVQFDKQILPGTFEHTLHYLINTVVDDKHQVIVHAEAFGSAQEHDLLEPMIEGARENCISASHAQLSNPPFPPFLKGGIHTRH